MVLSQILFIFSGTLWAIELIPQIVTTYKRKTVKDISLLYPLIGTLAFTCFLLASWVEKNWVLLYTHIFPFVCLMIFLGQILIYRNKKNKNLCNYCGRDISTPKRRTEKGCISCDVIAHR